MSSVLSEVRVAEIVDVAHGGYGIARLNEGICFVPLALPGDVVRMKISGKKRGVLWGEIYELIMPSADRVDQPQCPVFGTCGGCSWLHFRYPSQANWKVHVVKECFRRMAGITVEPQWSENPELRLGYRTRAEFHCDEGKWGFFANRSHRVVPIEECPLCHPSINTALQNLIGIKVKGSIEFTANPETGQVLVWLSQPVPEICKRFAWVNVIGGAETPYEFEFDGVPVINGTFSQSSLLLNRLLVKVVDGALSAPQSLLDLYCGAGNFSLKYAPQIPVLGLDVNPEAIRGAARKGCGNYRIASDKDFPLFIKGREWQTILLDPPRQGARSVMPALAACTAERIVYVSCDPASLARDAKTLLEYGWRIERAWVVDMFPNTVHVETVVCFTR